MASIEADLGNGNSIQMSPMEVDDDYRKRVMQGKVDWKCKYFNTNFSIFTLIYSTAAQGAGRTTFFI